MCYPVKSKHIEIKLFYIRRTCLSQADKFSSPERQSFNHLYLTLILKGTRKVRSSLKSYAFFRKEKYDICKFYASACADWLICLYQKLIWSKIIWNNCKHIFFSDHYMCFCNIQFFASASVKQQQQQQNNNRQKLIEFMRLLLFNVKHRNSSIKSMFLEIPINDSNS